MRASVSPTLGTAGESSLKKELRLSGELFSRLIDAFLNRMFDLRPEKAAGRLRYLVVLFFAAVFLISLLYFPLTGVNSWTQRLQHVFEYLFNPDFAESYSGNPFVNLFAYAAQVFTYPRIVQYFPIFLASFFIALQCAALYLADVFELEDVSVARRFIWAVALFGSEEVVRVSQGEISEGSRHSPAYLIGGPGKVIVDLDSVALFEKPDGTPCVIGPTALEPRGRAILEGFERFRQAIDIRDQYVDLDSKSQSVKSRSLDGIEVTATDVRLMFSIYRGGVKPSAEQPYPFGREAVEQIIYQATSRVTPGQANPSTYEFSWTNKMISLIRNELGTFMSKHKLSAYLASIGIPELQKLKQREKANLEQAQKLTQAEQDFLGVSEQKSLPEFQPRHKITNLFTQFADEFTKKAQNSGIELHWIGVGTWKTPAELIPEKHLEAWKLSNENLYRESEEVLHELEKDAIMQKTVSLIQDVPIATHLNATGEDHEKAMRSLLVAYHQQLLEAAEFMRAKGEAIPPSIEEAIGHINNMFGHYVQ
ncbi:MAG: hypothetical protein JW730_16435 [Anaerolineales bacterium]|nr:hypothetical protein [Anaerolineales bacterium]